MSGKKNIIIVVVFGVLAVSIATADLFMNRDVSGSPLVTSKVRAATLTYRRTLILSTPKVSPTDTPTPTITPITFVSNDPNASESAEITPTVTISPTPTIAAIRLTTTQTTPSPTLPGSGWTQVASIMFIASSIVVFLSFLF